MRADNLGILNPLRYRGYVYDQETELYYLQSRYYNPEWGRFISADAFVATGQGMLGNNMFAYCGNNPVMRGDAAGHAWKWWDDFWDGINEWLEEKKEEAQDNQDITTSSGFTGSVSFGAGSSISLGTTKDTKGNIGFMVTANGGAGFPSAGVGRFVSVSNTPTIYEQGGMGTTTGASGGAGVVAIGGEYNMIIDQQNGKVYHGGTLSVTAGLYPTIVEVHGEVGNTWVWGFNLYDVAIGIVKLIQGE